ncbi:MAG: hypothetical protein LC748_03830 [Thermomicrobia bacterium]|nr:hypothetical protein [Thermomicrobia bacterium]
MGYAHGECSDALLPLLRAHARSPERRRDDAGRPRRQAVLVAFGLSVLLALWYWRMRVETAATNAEAYAAYTKRMEMWNHTWYCDQCAAVFVREQ